MGDMARDQPRHCKVTPMRAQTHPGDAFISQLSSTARLLSWWHPGQQQGKGATGACGSLLAQTHVITASHETGITEVSEQTEMWDFP